METGPKTGSRDRRFQGTPSALLLEFPGGFPGRNLRRSPIPPPMNPRRYILNIEQIKRNGIDIAVVSSGETVITDARSALDLAMSVKYETGASRIAVDKRAVCEDFFILSTGVAGEALQKLINYHIKAAFYGDFSRYTSKPLRDFIYESNCGKDFFFVSSQEEAIQKLTEAP